MTAVPGDGTVRAVSTLLVNRAQLLLPLGSQFREDQPEFESAIRGSSMWPAIPPGARLRVRLGTRATCSVGDVVLYLADDGYTVHRVVSRVRRVCGQTYLLTEGDARFAPDPPVPCGRVLGTVVAVEIAGRWHAPSPPAADRWHKRVSRAVTKTAMIAAMSFSISAANRLATLLLAAESAARAARRVAKREAKVAVMHWGVLLDRIRHPTVKFHHLDAARINALIPATRRREVERAITESLRESDNDYIRNPTIHNSRYRHLPRGIPALNDLYPPNVAVLDFLAHRIPHREQQALLDFPCGIGALLVYARDLGLARIHGYDNWAFVARSTAERFLRRFGIPESVLVAERELPALPVTIFTCIGYPFSLVAKNSPVWAKPSVRYVMADEMERPISLPGFRRIAEYSGLLTVLERVP